VDQSLDCLRGAAACARLQHPAQQDERDDRRRHLVVDAGGVAHHSFVHGVHDGAGRNRDDYRVGERHAGTDRDQRVHVGVAVADGGPRAAVELGSRVEDHRQGQGELHPVHPRELQVSHADDHDRQGENDGDEKLAAGGSVLGAVRLFLCVGHRLFVPGVRLVQHVVAHVADRPDQAVEVHRRRIEDDGGPAGGEVDVGLAHAAGVFERHLDRSGAGGASHARHRQRHLLGAIHRRFHHGSFCHFFPRSYQLAISWDRLSWTHPLDLATSRLRDFATS